MVRLALALLMAAVAGIAPASAGAGCDAPSAAFVAVVADPAQRSDFQVDVSTFQRMANTLRVSYCLPDERTTILAFDNWYSRDGYSYPPASEAAFRAAIEALAPAVQADPSMTVFIALSSHGSFTTRRPDTCGPAAASVGSLAALGGGGGHDGLLYDCELALSLDALPEGTTTAVLVDCSFCGGFSDSITAASGLVQDDALTAPSGVPAPGRVVITGCAVTTECFGSTEGGILYRHLNRVMDGGVDACDGFTAPGFPQIQGLNAPVQSAERDGVCTMSEWFYAAVDSGYRSWDAVAIQEQFRLKFGFPSLLDDVAVF